MTVRAGWAGLCGAIAVAMCCTACADPVDELRAAATAGVRDIAEKALRRFQESPTPTRESITRATDENLLNNPDQATILVKEIPESGYFNADFAFLALAGNGYSGEYVQVAVRLCVSYVGELGRPGSIRMMDRSCPAGLPGPTNGTPVDRDVTLIG
ncbi:hypothetical protein [Amycolatopsis xylanica]|uniref:hypothetical protein n=1 Tax=Amycolatopsis xylanica TaxID=589385 RepID=UPI00115FE498|nr:hypothetical protein [Amycolatopsis xylanica]